MCIIWYNEIVWARMCRMYSMYQFYYLFSMFAFYKGFGGKTVEVLTSSSEKNQDGYSPVGILSGLGINWGWLLFSGVLFLVTIRLQRLGFGLGLIITAYVLAMTCLTLWQKGFRFYFKTRYF